MAAADPYRDAASKILEQTSDVYEGRSEPLRGLSEALSGVAAPEEVAAQEDPNPEKAEDEEASSEEVEAAEEAAIQSLDELVQGLGWGDDASALDTLTVTHKVNGELKETTLGEALSQFRKGMAADERLEDAKRLTGELAAEKERLKSEHAEKLQDLNTSLSMVEQVLVGDREQLKQLDPDDPDYTRQRWALEDKMRQVQEARNQIAEHVKKAVEEARAEARKKLPGLVPEWANQSAMHEEMRSMDNFLLKRGFTQQEINGIIDPKAVTLVRDAMLYHQAKAGAGKVKEKVKPTLKISKPGPTQTKGERNVLKMDDQLKRLKKTAKSDNRALAAEIVKQRLGLT